MAIAFETPTALVACYSPRSGLLHLAWEPEFHRRYIPLAGGSYDVRPDTRRSVEEALRKAGYQLRDTPTTQLTRIGGDFERLTHLPVEAIPPKRHGRIPPNRHGRAR